MLGQASRAALALVAIAAGILVSVCEGVPSEMPAPSLGSELLMHLERSVMLLGLVGGTMLVAVRAMEGKLPTKLGQIEYPEGEVVGQHGAMIAAHEERLLVIEGVLPVAHGAQD